MTPFGLSPLAFLVGALALAGGLAALHLLRVRLRRVEVDTLLFFRLAGALQKPRVLPGAPARWLAFVLSLLVALLAWTALAAPRSGLDAPSRFVVVEPDAGSAPERLAQARALLAAGLGPRGMVLAATSPPRVLLHAGEPVAALDGRGDVLATGASAAGAAAALRVAGDHATAGDEVVWLAEEPLAAADATVTHVPVPRANDARLQELAWQRTEDGDLVLAVRGTLRTGELRAGDTLIARASAATDLPVLQFGPFRPAGGAPLTLALAGLQPLAVAEPPGEPLRVAAAADLGGELARALAAVLAVDGELAPAADAASADVVVAAADDPADPRPRIVLTPGVGSGPREAMLTAGSPVHASLRDGRRRTAAALPLLAGDANVWVVDAAQGGALAAAVVDGERRRLWIVDWLLQPITRADTPTLLATALRELGGRPRTLLAVAGQPLVVPAAFAAPTRLADIPVHAVDGSLLLRPERAGVSVLQGPGGPRTVTALAARRGLPDGPAPATTLVARGGDGSWVPWLAVLLLALLVVDAVLYHRGRLP